MIDFGHKELDIREPFLTIAGQTAPSPGITIIRGGLNVHPNDVVIRHIHVWAHNVERSPLFKGGVHGSIVNNMIYDPGKRAVHYNLMALEWATARTSSGA